MNRKNGTGLQQFVNRKKWKPDEAVLRNIKKNITTSDLKNGRLFIGQKTFTWPEFLKEIKQGTKIGRAFYFAYQDKTFVAGGSK